MAKSTKTNVKEKNEVTENPPAEFRYRETKVTDKSITLMLSNVRLAFVNIANPDTRYAKAKNERGEPLDGKYSATLLIPKNSGIGEKLAKSVSQLCKTHPKIAAAAVKAVQDKDSGFKSEQAFKAAIFKRCMTMGDKGALLKDGDKTKNKDGIVYDGMKGKYTLRIQSNAVKKENGFAPTVDFKIVYKDKTPIAAHEMSSEIYSGVWCDVIVNLSVYDFAGNLGITCYIGGIMKLKDDQKLGSSDPFDVRDDIADDVASEFDGGF